MFPKKLYKAVATALIATSSLAFASTELNSSQAIKGIAKAELPAKQLLRFKLSNIKYFSAHFMQTIIDGSGEKLQEATGELTVAKPNLVNWHTKSPDETLIVSDGATLWFYDPFIEQATAYNVSDTIENTPILLITNNDAAIWQKFTVNQVSKGKFEIISTEPNSRVESLEITFNDNSSLIESFTIKDATGQISQINLSQVDTAKQPEASRFQFTLPDGVTLDDQR